MNSIDASYRYCRRLNFRFGSTYFWATSILPADKRRHVHAIYAFCRYADDLVDHPGPEGSEQSLGAFKERAFADLARGESSDQLMTAVVHTASELKIDPECFERFMHSMEMDLTVTSYETFDDLMTYMDGSAAVIGEMMLPVLGPADDAAFEPARNLGIAFQLTNFLRDVDEDLDRGRVYVPQETLLRFGTDPHARVVDSAWREAMRHEIARTRGFYDLADKGIDELPPRSARCVAAARDLYSGILEAIETNDYDIFGRRARVPYWRKVAALPAAVAPARRKRGGRPSR